LLPVSSLVVAALCAAPVRTGITGTRPCGGALPSLRPPPTVRPPDTATTLVAYQWQLASATDASGQSIAALFPTPDKPLGLQFADGRLGVTGG
jgi:hypothetical protein